MTQHDPQPPLSDAEAGAIARHAGITVPAERLPHFANDLAGLHELIAHLDHVAPPEPPAPPHAYDAAWPDANGGNR